MKYSSDHNSDKYLRLWKDYLAGDSEALGNLYKALHKKIFLYAYALVKNKEEAQDILQEVFKKLMEQKSENISDMEGWLKKSAYFIFQNTYRKGNTSKKYVKRIKQSQSNFTLNLQGLEAEKILDIIHTTLTPKNASLIELVMIGYKNQEIASKLDMTEKQVRVRKSESRKKLKRILR